MVARRTPRLFASLLIALLALGSLAARARADGKDRWYIMEMAGGKAGWMHTTQTESGDTITTTSEMKLAMSRVGGGLQISTRSEFVETKAGKPISMKSVQNLGAMAIDQTYTFTDKGIELTSVQAGVKTTSTLPPPQGEWLPPAAAERYVLQRFKSGAKEIIVRTIDPSSGPEVLTATRTGFEPATLTVMGREVQCTRSLVEMSLLPGVKSVEYSDAEGELVRSETTLGTFAVTMIAASKEDAQAEGEAGPEVMAGTFIHPDKPIKNPRRTTTVVYTLSVTEGQVPELPQTGSQHVEAVDAKTARVTVEARDFAPAPEKDATDPAYLRATSMANADDEVIKAMAQKATQGAGPDKARRAEALRRHVHTWINKKDLGVGFASASEVARNRQGDCSEHGVLLAALLRADGIPSRVASGVVYVDGFGDQKNIFGYHMWAQALLTIDGKPRWVDLDATLPPSTPFDATHITMGTSALAEGDMTSGMASVAACMGRLHVKVESVE